MSFDAGLCSFGRRRLTLSFFSRPTRFQAQYDAVHLLTSRITDDNPESTVGLMSMGNESPTLATPLTGNKGRGEILKGLNGLKIGGESHLSQSIQVAMVCTSVLILSLIVGSVTL